MTFRKAIEVATTEFVIKITVPRWAMGLTKRFQRVRDGFDDMHVRGRSCQITTTHRFLQLYIKEMIDDHQGADMNDRDDLFSNLLKANNEDSEVNLDLQELIANTYMFLVAGIEVSFLGVKEYIDISIHSIDYWTYTVLCIGTFGTIYRHTRKVIPAYPHDRS